MEDATRSPFITMFGSLSDNGTMDIDLADDLFSEGCWLETRECSNLFQQGDLTFANLLDSSCFSPASGVHDNSLYPSTPPNVDHQGTEKLGFSDTNTPPAETPTETVGETQPLQHYMTEGAEPSAQLDSCPVEEGWNLDGYEVINSSSELSKRWWIEPRANVDSPGTSVKERLVHVLRYIMESTKDGDVLAQIWVPIKKGGKNVLTTSGQPFSLNPHCQRLANYRAVSTNYLFSAEEDSNMVVGLPGRVFLGRLPEWTPDVRYFSSEQYPRVGFARQYDVRGTIALPVFERGSQACLGVMEVVMTAQKINYRPELENICKALQAVDLSTSEVSSTPHFKVRNYSYQVVLAEIAEVLRAVCEVHRLPLAQAWVPCIQQGKKGSQHTDENYADCVSTVDAACHVSDPCFWGFHDACSEHHLLRGQGVAGKAFTTNQPCFSEDITTFSKAEYPLSHYAKMFSLHAAVAIRLHSVYTGTDDYVLEFFLPVDCRNNKEQKLILKSLSVIIQQVCRSLRVITEKEREDGTVLPFNKAISLNGRLGKSTSVVIPNRDEVSDVGVNPSVETSEEKSSWNSSVMWGQNKGKNVSTTAFLPLEFQKQGWKENSHCDHIEVGLHSGDVKQQHEQGMAKINVKRRGSSFGKPHVEHNGNEMEKRRTKIERTITLQVLQQYFAGSLKDAAKGIGVCPTTLKRICRQHGIARWPSRKIKKVGNSLRKLQVVIDSVQGAEGVVQIGSLYANLPKSHGSGLTSQNPSSNNFSKLGQTSHQKSPRTQSEGVFSIVAHEKSQASSCSQSSSSSLGCSTLAEPQSPTGLLVNEIDSKAEDKSYMLKGAYSEAELHALRSCEEMRPLRSHSHESLNKHSLLKCPSLPKSMPLSQKCNSFKVKVLYGEEKVRFSLHPSWGFQDLLQEIAKRFNIDDVSLMALKYLDDDSEWVLLTCDADLQECKDVFKSSHAHAMKLSVHLAAQAATRNSLQNTALS